MRGSSPALLTFGLGPGALRFLLALGVVLFHGTRFMPYGHTAVYVFFVLSGFWMSRMYESEYAHKTNPLATYAISRALRIYPLYLVIIALTLLAWSALTIVTGRLDDIVERSTTLDALARNAIVFGLDAYHAKILTPAWSLDYELQFYVVLPVLVALRRKLGDRALWAIALLSAAAVLGRTFGGLRTQVLEYLALFVFGMLLHQPSPAPRFAPSVVRASSALALLVFALPYASIRGPIGNAIFYDRSVSWLGLNGWETTNVLLALLMIPLVDHNVRGQSSARDRALGGASYALYLLHWSVLCVYGSYAEDISGVRNLAYAAVYVAVSCVLALAAQRFIDAPFEARRRRWLAGRAATSAPLLPPRAAQR